MPTEIFVVIADRQGEESRVTIPFPPTVDDLTSAQAIADLIMATIDPLVYGKIVGAGVSFSLEVDAVVLGIKTAANILADVRDKARFGFISSGAAGLFTKTLTLPTYNETYTLDTTKNLDLADPDVDLFVDSMINGFGLVAPPEPTDSREYDLISLDYAKEV